MGSKYFLLALDITRICSIESVYINAICQLHVYGFMIIIERLLSFPELHPPTWFGSDLDSVSSFAGVNECFKLRSNRIDGSM